MPFQDDLTYASKKEASQHEGTPQVPHTHTQYLCIANRKATDIYSKGFKHV